MYDPCFEEFAVPSQAVFVDEDNGEILFCLFIALRVIFGSLEDGATQAWVLHSLCLSD